MVSRLNIRGPAALLPLCCLAWLAVVVATSTGPTDRVPGQLASPRTASGDPAHGASLTSVPLLGGGRQPARRLQQCAEFPIYFTNNCDFSVWVILNARLATSQASDYCKNASSLPGEWCTRGWFEVEPGATTGGLIDTDNSIFYFWGQGTDSGGQEISWGDDTADGNTLWVDTDTGDYCTDTGPADNCQAFRLVNTFGCGTSYTYTLLCDTWPFSPSPSPSPPPSPSFSPSPSPSSPPPSPPPSLSGPITGVRLADGPNSTSGRLEVQVGGQWGTVCDDGFDSQDATVACRQLGLGNAGLAKMGGWAVQGSPSQPILMDDVMCTGSEASLDDCTSNYPSNCGHSEDAGVVCYYTTPSQKSSSSVPIAAIAGAAAGAVVLLLVVAGFVVWRVRRSRRRYAEDAKPDWIEPPVAEEAGGMVAPPPTPGYSYGGYPPVGAAAEPVASGADGGGGGAEPSPAFPAILPLAGGIAALPAEGTSSLVPPAVGIPPEAGLPGDYTTLPDDYASLPAEGHQRAPGIADGGTAGADAEEEPDRQPTFPTRPPGGPPGSLVSALGPGSGAAAAAGAGGQPVAADSLASRNASQLGSAGQPPPSVAPPGTPSLPATAFPQSIGTPGSLRSAASEALPANDPLVTLGYLSQGSRASTLSGGSSGLRPPAGGSGVVDVRPWEMAFEELIFVQAIGEGSFGRVYLANWHETQVAVKVLLNAGGATGPPSQSQRAVTLSRPMFEKLEAEAGLMASMRHPCICSFYGMCREPPSIITEYCARGSLSDVLGEAAQDARLAADLTWARRLEMAIDASKGMLYLHTRPAPIIHRDLKSPNLLVDESWRCKVSDFNLSRILQEDSQSSSMTAMNPRWLAPEVMTGERATQASDVYAFGVVLWELATWSIPWSSSNPWQVVSLVVAGGRLEIPPRQRLPGPDTATFEGLDAYFDLVRRCWAQNPFDRPTFHDIVPALRELLKLARRAAPAAGDAQELQRSSSDPDGASAAFGAGVAISAARPAGHR